MRDYKQAFIKKANVIHNYKYDYSKVNYIDSRKHKVCIICPEHGEFWQTPYNHLLGYEGCKKCASQNNSKRLMKTLDKFIEDAKGVHGDKYDYSKVEYVGKDVKVCIICSEHGEFWQTPGSHLMGSGCPICAGKFVDSDIFVERSNKIHNNFYDYSKVLYTKNDVKVTIICPIHGEFEQKPCHHLIGAGCPECGKNKVATKNANTLEAFIKNAREVHGDKYDYSKVEYINNRTKVCIICPKHGEFWQLPHDHIQGCGCQKCASSVSNGENRIISFLKECGVKDIEERNHNLLAGKLELDIWLPEYNIAIEYNGLRWHSELFHKDKYYHVKKTELCAKKNIRLIHIFEDELLEHEEIVFSKLRHILKKDTDLPVCGGRQCQIKEINYKDASLFLDKNHLQGKSKSTIYLGAFFNNELIAVMSFLNNDNNWELTRFATNINYRCPGVANKLLSFFKKNYTYKTIKSFLDLRWGCYSENLYTKLGFRKTAILSPDYSYVKNNKRCHKFNFRKQKLIKDYGFPKTMTENEMTRELGYYRIWNCGLIKYEITNEDFIQ